MQVKEYLSSKELFHQKIELSGLAIDIVSIVHLLKGADFDAIVGHSTLIHILKRKVEQLQIK